ncbi:MAG TPA: holo-[acyl-carrier-protein] synthase [Planctomycetes bacterium]|jgi:holo-[acyl-carrier protein] synthase|nr:holo-[acyl-carrier-protein] synthase [Planctomycetota bacterium]
MMTSSKPMSDPLPSIFGIGLDLVDIPRLAKSIEQGGQAFLDRIFTPHEQEYCSNHSRPNEHYAARWAAKEAAMKVLGTGWSGGVAFTDFEVINDSDGRPHLEVTGVAAERSREQDIIEWQLSLSHTGSTAGAVAQAISVRPGA